MAGPSDLRLLGCSRRAGERTPEKISAIHRFAAVLRLALSQSGTSLRAIVCTAPLLGMFGTGCVGGVAETFVPLAVSLWVSVFPSCGFHDILAKIEIIDFEMRVGILNLFDHLVHRH